MWIEIATNTKQLKTEEMDEAVTFNDNGSAQVTEDVGELLTNNFETITEKSTNE